MRYYINESLGNDYLINICESTYWPPSSCVVPVVHKVVTTHGLPITKSLAYTLFFWNNITFSFLTHNNLWPYNPHISYLGIHPSIVCNHFIPFYGVAGVVAGANPSCLQVRAGYRVPGQVASSSQGPSLMAEAAMPGANCTSGAIWGSLSCSRTCSSAQPGVGIWTSDLPITSRNNYQVVPDSFLNYSSVNSYFCAPNCKALPFIF